MSTTGLEKICLRPNFVYVYVVWIQYTNVTDGRTDGHTDSADDKDRAYA